MTSRPRRKLSSPVPGQPLPALLSIPDIARLCGNKRGRTRRVLDSAGLSYRRSGRTLLVSTATLREKMPDLVRSMEDRLLQSPIPVDTRT